MNTNEEIEKMINNLLTNPPLKLINEKVIKVIDLNKGYPDYPLMPPTNGILILTDKNTRVLSRPSGTEPKVKFYLENYTEANANNIGIKRKKQMSKLEKVSKEIYDFAMRKN